MTEKILLDTDIGFDIDDAVCLAYLLAHPQCDLLGITTVTGEPEKRAQMCSALCRIARKDVPIFPGTPAPLLVEQRQPKAPQAGALTGMDYQIDFPRFEAIEFLRKTIRSHPGDITLLTIGPLTNIGLLFAMDPEIPTLLKGWVGMGGLYTHRIAGLRTREYNIMLDPHAAAIAFRAPVPFHRMVGIEVTSQLFLSQEEVRSRFQGPLLEMVLQFAEVWFEMVHKGITFHDPLAAAVIFNPQLCEYERGLVEVELESQRLAGFTHWTSNQHGMHEVVTAVDRERYFADFFSVLEQ